MTPVRPPCPAPHATVPVSLALVLALALASPGAHAQHAHHAGMPMPQLQSHDAAADGPAETDHAAMEHGQAAEHSTIDHAAMQHVNPAVGSSATPREPIPPVTPADIAAAFPDITAHAMRDNAIHGFVLVDRLETGIDGDAQSWAARSWIGTDRDRVWLRSEGERTGNGTHSADLEVFYGHSVARWWELLVGVRHDFAPAGAQDFIAVGVTGLAPYKFEVSATAYLGASGHSAARLEVEYETLLTNRLVLQPLLEANLYGQEDPRRGLGSGLSTVEAGLRLRYEFTRRFAPYIGVVRERAFGGTATLRRGSGEDTDDTRFVAGLRLWF
jgi:copper resistance protein B